MNQPIDPKIAKKLLKAEAKAQKKRAKLATESKAAPLPPAVQGSGNLGSPSPADGSAAAAERQVRLQRWRVAIALLTLLVGVVTCLLTVRPWESKQPESAQTIADQPEAE